MTTNALSIRSDGRGQTDCVVAQETPVAISINGTTHAVMMASPQNLDDFAHGFVWTEGILTDLSQIESLDILDHDTGVEAQFWLSDTTAAPFLARRRAMAGPIGCGLCGIDSLDQAVRPLPQVGADLLRIDPDHIIAACDNLRDHQPMHDATHAVHSAGFMDATGTIVIAREDVGRHNALDKLIGALLRQGIDPATGAMVLTSRVSVEMVQKTAFAGCGMIIAVSAPTAHALELAQAANITLCANTKSGRTDCFTHSFRIKGIE